MAATDLKSEPPKHYGASFERRKQQKEEIMPKYLDHHKAAELPPAVMKQIADQIKSGKADANGMRPINGFTGKNGDGWCLMEAPNVESVKKLHDALGIKVGTNDIVEVTSVV